MLMASPECTVLHEELISKIELNYLNAKLVAQMVKCLPAMRETWVRFLGREDPLEKEMEPTPVFLPGESQGRGSLVVCRLWGLPESDTTEVT